MHSMAVVTSNGVNLFELAVAAEIFGVVRPETSEDWYRFEILGDDGELTAPGGVALRPSGPLSRATNVDTVIVPAFTNPSLRYPTTFTDAIRAAHERGARLVSLCTGAFALAAAGVLDGRSATTHWRHADQLSEWYPTIDVTPDVLYVDDGDILTSAGSSAAIDLCLHIVGKDFGAVVAAELGRRLVLAPHRTGGQAQFARPTRTDRADHSTLGEVMAWAADHLTDSIRLDDLARVAHSSKRTLSRRFTDLTGVSPMVWLTRQRIERAKELLETTDLAMPHIAEHSGLGSQANLRAQFHKHVSVSPQHYRTTFRLARRTRQKRG